LKHLGFAYWDSGGHVQWHDQPVWEVMQVVVEAKTLKKHQH
jgi:hypothetical protein